MTLFQFWSVPVGAVLLPLDLGGELRVVLRAPWVRPAGPGPGYRDRAAPHTPQTVLSLPITGRPGMH